MPVTVEAFNAGGATRSSAIIQEFTSNEDFQALSTKYLKELYARDKEDGEKLAAGIQLAVDKGVLPADVTVEPVTIVSATGKSPDQVADEIIAKLGSATSTGCVVTLQGLSGTGKGTTVEKLKEKLPNVQTWSNGNIFRSLTLLAKTYADQNPNADGTPMALEDACTAELLDSYLKMLEFGQFGGKFDTKIEGLGMKDMVSEVANTKLKTISSFIPTVAKVTQGEVVKFVQDALAKMSAGGVNVILEGRTETLNHIRTPNRFELILDDMTVVGMRQAALIMGSEAEKALKDKEVTDASIKAALDEELNKLKSK